MMVSRHPLRLVLGCIVILGLLGGSRAEAGYWDVEPLTDNTTNDRCAKVSAEGNVTWMGHDGNDWELYFRAKEGTTIRVTDNELDDGVDSPPMSFYYTYDFYGPKISGSKVVWTTCTGPSPYSGYSEREPKVFLYDGESVIEFGLGSSPQIDGSNVVWTGSEWLGPIELYDGKTVTQISPEGMEGFRPKVSGSNIVWVGGGFSNVFLYNGTDAIKLTDNPGGQEPAIASLHCSESAVFWSYYGVLFAYDITSGTTRQGTPDRRSYRYDCCGRKAVWFDSVDGNIEIFLYDLDTDTITQVTDNENVNANPHIDAHRILYTSRTAYTEEDLLRVACVLVYDIDTGVTAELARGTYIDDAAWRHYPGSLFQGLDISGYNIVWSGWDGNDFEIFMATYIPEPSCAAPLLVGLGALMRGRGKREQSG